MLYIFAIIIAKFYLEPAIVRLDEEKERSIDI